MAKKWITGSRTLRALLGVSIGLMGLATRLFEPGKEAYLKRRSERARNIQFHEKHEDGEATPRRETKRGGTRPNRFGKKLAGGGEESHGRLPTARQTFLFVCLPLTVIRLRRKPARTLRFLSVSAGPSERGGRCLTLPDRRI